MKRKAVKKPIIKPIVRAFHEAGHSVASLYYQRGAGYLSIIPKGHSLGRVRLPFYAEQLKNITDIHHSEIEIDIHLAGLAAVNHFCKDQCKEYGYSDYLKAAKVAVHWAKVLNDKKWITKTSGYYDSALSNVDAFNKDTFWNDFGFNIEKLVGVTHIWNCIDAVAKALLKKKKLYASEATMIMGKAWAKADGEKAEEQLVLKWNKIINNAKQECGRPWTEPCRNSKDKYPFMNGSNVYKLAYR